jgi:hypothetical protein
MKLSELIPQKVSFKLSRVEKELTMNMITLEDAAWLEENYPGQEATKIFTEVRIKDILRLATRILTDESKIYLGKAKILQVDDFGNEKEVEGLTLSEKLYRILAEGELMVLVNAIFDVRMKSQEIALTETDKIQKKSQAILNHSGKQSTTSLPVNTESPSTSSEE